MTKNRFSRSDAHQLQCDVMSVVNDGAHEWSQTGAVERVDNVLVWQVI